MLLLVGSLLLLALVRRPKQSQVKRGQDIFKAQPFEFPYAARYLRIVYLFLLAFFALPLIESDKIRMTDLIIGFVAVFTFYLSMGANTIGGRNRGD